MARQRREQQARQQDESMASSDYGSDIDPEDIEVGHVLAQIAATAPKTVPYTSVETQGVLQGRDAADICRHRSTSVEFEYDTASRRVFSVPRAEPPQTTPAHLSTEASREVELGKGEDDKRAPLHRFRSRRPLSVTDLVSPAWCELQYWYTLTTFGRKPATSAMKAGTKIHQTLEEQVHRVVPVQIQTKEDRFGLRIWNIIQGLRCLRETGLTRELEVWGVLEGQVVNGVIDEVSFACPDPDREEQLDLAKVKKAGGTLPLGQLNIEQAFAKTGQSLFEKSRDPRWIGGPEPDRRVYITDVKTRGVRSIPQGASLRPTWMQLMLYRKLLESLSLNNVDAETVFARYNVAPLDSFSEAFILEAGAIGVEHVEIGSGPPDTQQSNELRSHSNLLSLWSLMITEFQHAMPAISDILRVEFRYSRTGEVIGSELTVYDPGTVDAYSKDEIEWWNGSREAKGVEIEEAFKCRICDFAEECTWRKTKIEEATEKHRLKRKVRKSPV